jgi:hypothetical protein
LRTNLFARHLWWTLSVWYDLHRTLCLRSGSCPACTSNRHGCLLWGNWTCLASWMSCVGCNILDLHSTSLCISLSFALLHSVHWSWLGDSSRSRSCPALRLPNGSASAQCWLHILGNRGRRNVLLILVVAADESDNVAILAQPAMPRDFEKVCTSSGVGYKDSS